MSYMETYREWCTNPYFSEETRAELEAIKDNEAEIEDRFYRQLEFGTGGLRGVIGAGITWTVIKSVDALGPARSALFIVVSQLAVAYLISLSGMFGMEKEPFSWRKLIGLLIAAGGIVLFQWE